jgi:WD40 repeat protein
LIWRLAALSMLALTACSPVTRPVDVSAPLPASTTPAVTPVPSPIPIPATQTPFPRTVFITPANANRLTEVAGLDYGPHALVRAVAWSDAGQLLGVASGEQVYVYVYQTGELVQRWVVTDSAQPTCLVFSPDGDTLAVGSLDGNIRLRDAGSGELRATLSGHMPGITRLAFHPSGVLLASSANDGTVRIWDWRAGTQSRQILGSSFGIPAVAYSPDGSLLTWSGQGTVRLYSSESYRVQLRLPADGTVYGLAFAPDGKSLAGSMDARVMVWDTASGEVRYELPVTGVVWSVAFSPSGDLLAATGKRSAMLWEAASGRLLAELGNFSQPVWSLAFSPDGQLLATGSLDGTLRIWAVLE